MICWTVHRGTHRMVARYAHISTVGPYRGANAASNGVVENGMNHNIIVHVLLMTVGSCLCITWGV